MRFISIFQRVMGEAGSNVRGLVRTNQFSINAKSKHITTLPFKRSAMSDQTLITLGKHICQCVNTFAGYSMKSIVSKWL